MLEILPPFCTLPERSNSSWRVKDDLSSIHTVHEPVERVMATVADIHSYLPKLCLEHCVTSVALHVICRLQCKINSIAVTVTQVQWITECNRKHPLTSLKSPTLGMWFFLLFPRTFPELEMTTAVFHRVPLSSSRSRIGETTTMLYFLASYWQNSGVIRLVFCGKSHRCTVSDLWNLTSWQKRVVLPSSADSANSVHGCFSRVQKAKGMAVDSKRQVSLFYWQIRNVEV